MSDVPLLSIARTDSRRPIMFCWGVSSFFGWGVYGMNLMLHLADHPDYVPFCGLTYGPGDVVVDPLRERRLAEMAQLSSPIWTALANVAGDEVLVDHPVLEGLGNGLSSAAMVHGKFVTGRPSLGVLFLEQARLTAAELARADRFALLVAGSRWNEEVLRRHGVRNVTTVLQGVDPTLYHPAPRFGMFPGRFVIFSGGKLEFRKGQDLVLATFRAFQQRHPEALLVTAWHSPWSDLAARAVGHPGLTIPEPAADGSPDVVRWAVENGIPHNAVISVGHAPNIAIPHVVREADVALFMNRAEGGTNLVAMECMACGIPTIMSANTGHLDLLGADIALSLERQGTPVSDYYDTTDWGESDVEEALEKLELVWRDRDAAAALGARAADFMRTMTWRSQLALLIRAIEPFFD